MRRFAILVGAVGLVALGLATTPAQAHDGWWGYSGWREHAWREHEWREHHYWHPWYYHRGSYARPGFYAPRAMFGFGSR